MRVTIQGYATAGNVFVQLIKKERIYYFDNRLGYILLMYNQHICIIDV